MNRHIVKYAGLVLASLCIAVYALYIFHAVSESSAGYTKNGTYLFSDFCHHYITSCGLRQYEAKDLYTPEILEKVKVSVLGPAPAKGLENTLALLYPPTYLFLSSILGFFPYVTAYAVFMLTGIGLCLWAGSTIYKNSYMAIGLLSFPATFICLAYGQTGFILAAFLVLSLSYSDTRPVLSGFFLALALIKPQFCLLPFVSYLASRNSKALAATAAAALLLFITSVLVFGFEAWTHFLRAVQRTSEFSRVPFGQADSLSYESMYTVYASLMRYGFSYATAYTTQALIALLLIAFTASIWRYSDSKPLKMAATLISVPFCTHFGYYYDLVMLYFAILCFFKFKQTTTAAVRSYEYAIIAFVYAALFLGILNSTKALSQLLLPVAALAFIGMLLLNFRNTTRRNAREPFVLPQTKQPTAA